MASPEHSPHDDFGVPPDWKTSGQREREEVHEGDVVFLAALVDDSGSVAGQNPKRINNKPNIISGHNTIASSLLYTRSETDILFTTQYMNGFRLNNWVGVDQIRLMDEQNYIPRGRTPLFNSTVPLLDEASAKMEEVREQGRRARLGLFIISDGKNVVRPEEARYTAGDVARRIEQFIKDNDPDFPNTFTFMGIDIDDGETDYRQVAREMGIHAGDFRARRRREREKILQVITTDCDPATIRAHCAVWSRTQVNFF